MPGCKFEARCIRVITNHHTQVFVFRGALYFLDNLHVHIQVVRSGLTHLGLFLRERDIARFFFFVFKNEKRFQLLTLVFIESCDVLLHCCLLGKLTLVIGTSPFLASVEQKHSGATQRAGRPLQPSTSFNGL